MTTTREPFDFSAVPAGALCWHIHHNTLCERAGDSLADRAAYVRDNKPEYEIPTRLRLMRPVLNGKAESMWKFYNAACGEAQKLCGGAACGETWKFYNAACAEAWKLRGGAACGEAQKLYDEARKPLEALHAVECPNCPWDGTTIFPKPLSTN